MQRFFAKQAENLLLHFEILTQNLTLDITSIMQGETTSFTLLNTRLHSGKTTMHRSNRDSGKLMCPNNILASEKVS